MPLFQSTSFEDEMMPQQTVQPEEDEPIVEETRDDIPKAEQILENILRAHDRILDDPEPVVRLHTLGASSVDFVVRPWAKTPDFWTVHFDITEAVKLEFDKAGISIPFPQMDVHVHKDA